MALEVMSTVLLSSGHPMPIIGLGTWQTDDEESVVNALETAIKLGYRHIDTAFSYVNEPYIGSALKKIFENGLIKREELFIVSKIPPNGMRSDGVNYFVRNSLKNMQLDYIDLYLIHFPVPTKRTENDSEIFPVANGDLLVDENVCLMETWQALEALVDGGLIKSIGLSNFNSVQIQRIYQGARIKPAVLQAECHAYLPQFELVDFCRKLNISFTAYSPLGTPGLPDFVRKHGGGTYEPEILLKDERLKPLTLKYKKSPAQILLRYLVQRGINVIPKSSNPNRIKENIEIFDFSLDSEDMNILNSMGKNLRHFAFNHLKGLVEHPEYPFKIPF